MFNKLKSFESNFTITRAAFIVGFFALLSKLIALVREPLFASTFGGPKIYIWDIYNAAFRLPDFIMNVFILGTLSVVLIPVFVELLVEDKKRAQDFANTIATLAMLTIGGSLVLLYILAYPVTKALVPGFDISQLQQTVSLTRIIILAQIIFILSNICSNLLYSYKRFIMAGVAPVLYNLGIISGVLFFYPAFGIEGLGYGVLLGAAAHLLIQLPELRRCSFRLRPAWNIHDKAMLKFCKLYVPRIFAVDLSVFALLVSTYIASKFKTGSIAIFTLALNVTSMPVSIVALSLATAIFPALSEAYAQGQEEKFLSMLKKTLVQVFYFMVPVTLLMLVFRAQGVRLYVGHGNFTWENTILTFSILGILAFALISQSVIPILARAFYSRQNTIIPLGVNLTSLFVFVLLAFMLQNHFGIYGVAAAFAIASIFNALVLFIILRLKLYQEITDKSKLVQFDEGLFLTSVKIVVASIAMAVVSYGGLYLFEPLVNTHTTIGLLVQVTGAGIFGLIVFFTVSSLLQLKESQIIIDYLKRILSRGQF